jgi:predicted phage replisome organizer
MSDNKKYFWLQLKDDFFRDKEIKKLRTIAGGDTFTIIYLKMQLLSLKDEGRLYFDNLEETFVEELALDLDEKVENVKVTLMYLKQCGLVQEITPVEYVLPQAQDCIGTESHWAEKKREYRKNSQERAKMLENSGQCPRPVQNCPTEIEIYQKQNINPKQNINKQDAREYPSSFLNIWENIYPHSSDRGSKPQTYKNWCNLLKEGITIQTLESAASNYKTHCELKKTRLPYKCSNFYGEARYFENFTVINLTKTQEEVKNEQRRTGQQPSGLDAMRALAAAKIRAEEERERETGTGDI